MNYTYKKQYRLADIYKLYWKRYQSSPSRSLYLEDKHYKAVNKCLACRTSKIGYHYFKCDRDCGSEMYVYHSCKHRFCGSCGSKETQRWAETQLSTLLEIKHHHVVFTLPNQLRHLSKVNGNKLYDLLFQCSQQVIQDWFDYKHGWLCGIVSVLHTAGSDLKYHPHVHMIVSGGGQDKQSEELQELAGDYLVNHQHLKRQFKKKYLAGIEDLYKKGDLTLYGSMSLSESYFKKYIEKLQQIDWIVSVQAPLHDREMIMKYVGRYTKRACMSEYRLKSIDNEIIRFSYKDYKNSERGEAVKESEKSMHYTVYLDKLLQHVPSSGYRMVRYYGLYSNHYLHLRPGNKKKEMREETQEESSENKFKDWEAYWLDLYGEEVLTCKCCGGRYKYVGQYFEKKVKIIRKEKVPEKLYANSG